MTKGPRSSLDDQGPFRRVRMPTSTVAPPAHQFTLDTSTPWKGAHAMHIIRITSPQRRPARRFSLTAFSHAEAYGHSPSAWARPWVQRAKHAGGKWITVQWPTCDFETWRLAQGLQDHPCIEVDGDRIRWVDPLV